MSAAPRPTTPRAPPPGPGPPFSAGRSILPASPRASRSFVLAAARLRALHLDPLLGRRPHTPAAGRTKNDQTDPCPSPRLHRAVASPGGGFGRPKVMGPGVSAMAIVPRTKTLSPRRNGPRSAAEQHGDG